MWYQLGRRNRSELIFFYGHALRAADLAALDAHGYTWEQFPAEWLVHVGFGSGVPLEDRKAIADVIDDHREDFLKYAPLGEAAFSIPPANHPFSLTRREYEKMRGTGSRSLSRPLTISTLASWAKLPLFARIVDRLRKEIPGLDVELLGPQDVGRLFSDSTSIRLSPLGISPADPLNHLAFLATMSGVFAETVPLDEIARIAVLNNTSQFNRAVKSIEQRIVDERRIIPIAHFPGVVASAPGLTRDESIAYTWGIQAWAYRLN